MAEQSLYKVQNKKAKKDEIKLVEKRDDIGKSMHVFLLGPDAEAQETLGFLAKRFDDMDDSRPDDEWDIRLKQYNADLVWREDGLANTNLPIEFATIRNKIADLQSSKTIVDLLPTEPEDVYKKDLMRDIWDFVWAEGDTEKEITKLWYGALIFGLAWWFEGLHKETWTRYEAESQTNGKVVGKPMTQTRSWLRGKAMDIRDVWIDSVPDISDATDCFIREGDLSKDALKGLLSDPNFNKEQVEAFIASAAPQSAGEHGTRSSYVFQTREELEDTGENKYTLLHYYNREKGIYIVTDDNFQFILREGVNPYPHGDLPISPLIDNPRYEELYGKGECELLENTKYERNIIRNQIIDAARMSNTMNLAVGENIAFEDSELVGGVMRVWNFQGNLGDTQFLKPPGQDSSLFNVEELLRGDGTWITGVDVNALAGAPTKTAFEARLQEQAKLKGIMVTMRQYDYFLTRMARQRLANIQFWLPKTTGKQILGNAMPNEDDYRTIPFHNKESEPVMGINKSSKKLEDKSVRLVDKDGQTEFLELTPKVIQSNFDILVTTPTTTPILRELDQFDMQEIFNTLMQMAQTEQGQEILNGFDFLEYYKDLIKQKGFDPDKYLKDDVKEKDMQELRASLLEDLPAPPMVTGGQAQTPAQKQETSMMNKYQKIQPQTPQSAQTLQQ